MIVAASVAERADALRQHLHELGAGVTVIAVTKGFDAEAITAAVAAGIDDIGENYAKELLAKLDTLHDGATRPRVHFVGHVQSNKVRQLAGAVDTWHTLDRTSLADELARRHVGGRGDVMVQVNTTAEAAKSGCSPDEAPGIVDYARGVGLDVGGLMTMGPAGGDRRAAAAAFRALRQLADGLSLPACSMGMSGDYDIAVAEGATHIRVGTLLFGERHRDR